MALQSILLSGDSQLEAAAVSDPAHILPGARGPHVGKIQLALIALDGAVISVDSVYGPATAAAVLAFKRKRGIINFAIQTSADNIVGKMTMAALDAGMLALEDIPKGLVVVRAVNPPFLGFADPADAFAAQDNRNAGNRSSLLLAFNVPVDIPKLPPIASILKLRLEPRTTGTLEMLNGKGAIVRCDNKTPVKGNLKQRTCMIFDPNDPKDANAKLRLVPEPISNDNDLGFGGIITLSSNRQIVSVDAFKPGNAFIDVSNGTGSQLFTVEVRAPGKGVVSGSPAPVFSHPESNGFISGRNESGVPGGVSHGRPMRVPPGGRNINLGGEHETPGFEDYTADLDFADCPDFPDRTKTTFRPWTGDSDPSVRVKDGEARNICIRNTPMTDTIIGEIRRIRAGTSRVTFSGDQNEVLKLIAALPGGKQIDRLDGPEKFPGDFAVVLDFG